MVDVTRYGGTGGEDFSGARRPREDMTTYDGSRGPRATTDILYGDAEDPSGAMPSAIDWSDALPQVQDILDETTTLEMDGVYFLSGENLVAHMSTIAPWCLATEQMNIVAEDGVDWGTGWVFKPISDVDPLRAHAASGIMIGKLSVNSIYIDPDQGISGDTALAIDGLAQYAHLGKSDPTLVNGPTAGDAYGNAVYQAPVYTYDVDEDLALWNKFGYTAGIADYPADTYGAVSVRIGMEIDDLIEMLQVGYSSRKNISRSTPGINIFDNFEVISAVENEEPIDESTSGVATSTMITDTGDYDS